VKTKQLQNPHSNRTVKRLSALMALAAVVVAVGLLGCDGKRQPASVLSDPNTNAASPSQLAGLLADTTWEWSNAGERIQFSKDGWIDHPGWYERGLATSWQVIDEHTVLLTIVEGRNVDRYAILVFNPDFTEYTGYSFHGGEIFMPCKRVQEGARNTGTGSTARASQFDRSGPRINRPVSARPFHPVSAEETDQPSYPWVVFGRVTDSTGNGMSNVSVSASCGLGTLMPTASTNTDVQGNYRLAFGPGRVWSAKSGRVDVTKTIEGVGVQAAIVQAGKSGYYEKDLGRQGDLRMARELPRPGEHPGIAIERIILPNQPKRVDFVMLPAALISGRVVAANGKSTQGRRFYVGSDKLPPGASVLCEFRPDAAGGFKVGGVPCQSYWFEPADGSLAGVRSNPLAISRAGNYDVEVSVNDADRKLTARFITAPAPSTGD
jgi:hypothetical protein